MPVRFTPEASKSRLWKLYVVVNNGSNINNNNNNGEDNNDDVIDDDDAELPQDDFPITWQP